MKVKKTMKKKITAALLCAIMTLSLAGCKENEENVSTPDSSNSSYSESANPTEESKPEYSSSDSKSEDSSSAESNTESKPEEDKPKPVASAVDWSTVPVADEKDFEYTVYEPEAINYSILKEEVIDEVEEELKDGFVAISGYNGQAEYINLPDQIEGKNHIFVSSNMDWGNNVKAIKFSDGFSSIRTSYLRVEGCLFTWGLGVATSVTELSIPDNWEYIGGFSGMPRLKAFNMPSKACEIWSDAFQGCAALESVTIPDSVTKIESGAFEGCTDISINFKGKTYNEKDIANLYDKDLSTM